MEERRTRPGGDLHAVETLQPVTNVTLTCADRVTTGACSICESNAIGTWVWEQTGDVFRGSYRTLSIAGLGFEPETREAFLARIDPEHRHDVRRVLASAAARREPFNFEFGVTIGGERRTIRMQGFPDLEAPDVERRFFGTMEDITARMQAADALLELSLAVEQSRDHVCIAAANGTIEYINPSWRQKAGRERSLVGMPVAVLLGDPRIWNEARAEIERSGMFRRRIRTTNGSDHYDEITMWPVRDVRGDIARIVVISSDVTDRTNAEEVNARFQNALRNAAHEWRQTVDAIDAAIIMIDPPATIRRMNLAARNLLGRREYALVGTSLLDFDLPEPWPTALRLVAQAAAIGLSRSAQVRDAATASTWDVMASVSLNEEVHDVVVVIREITSTVALQESLHRSEMMSAMGNLVAGVAHEVKNPLFGMTATLDAMERRFRDNADSQRYTSMMRRELDRLNELMRDLLEYGRAAVLDVQPTLLGSIVESAVDLCRADAAAKGVTIDNTVRPDFGPLRADASRLEQALRNVIDNAIRYSPSGTSVTITAQRVGDRLDLQIRDRGPGFSPDDLPRVFEPFFTRRQGGTGLGLSIVRRMIEEHSGRVTAGNASDHGAIVHIELPVEAR